MNIFFIIKLLSFLVHMTLGLYVLGRNPVRRLNQVFSLAVFSIAVMDLGYALLPLRSQGKLWLQSRNLPATAGWLSPFCVG